jgi:hypothetical protein
MTGIEGWRSDGHDHEVSMLITGVGGLGADVPADVEKRGAALLTLSR